MNTTTGIHPSTRITTHRMIELEGPDEPVMVAEPSAHVVA